MEGKLDKWRVNEERERCGWKRGMKEGLKRTGLERRGEGSGGDREGRKEEVKKGMQRIQSSRGGREEETRDKE